MTKPIRPRGPLRNLAYSLLRRKEVADEEISGLVEAVLKLEKATPEDLGSIVEIQTNVSDVTADHQQALAEKLNAFVGAIFPQAKDKAQTGVIDRKLQIIHDIKDEYLKDFVFKTIALLPKDQRIEMLEFLISLYEGLSAAERDAIFNKLISFEKNQRAKIVQFAVPLVKDIPEAYQRVKLFSIIARFSEKQIAEVQPVTDFLVENIPDGSIREDVLEAFLEVPEKEGSSIFKSLVLLFKDCSGRSFYIYRDIKDIPPERRAKAIQFTPFLIKGIQDATQRGFILKAVEEFPEEQIPKMLDLIEPHIEGIEDGFMLADILHALGMIAEQQRTDAVAPIVSLFSDIPDISQRNSMVRALEMIPEGQRAPMIHLLGATLNKEISDGSQRAEIFKAVFMFAPEDRESSLPKIIKEIQEKRLLPEWKEILQFVFKDEKVRDNSQKFLEKTLQSPLEIQQASQLGEMVQKNPDLFGLHMEHSLMQAAINAQILTADPENPKNPYMMYKKLQEFSLKEFSYTPKFEVAGEAVTFDLKTFQSGTMQEVLRKDLPPPAKKASPDSLDELTKGLDDLLEKLGKADRKEGLEAIDLDDRLTRLEEADKEKVLGAIYWNQRLEKLEEADREKVLEAIKDFAERFELDREEVVKDISSDDRFKKLEKADNEKVLEAIYWNYRLEKLGAEDREKVSEAIKDLTKSFKPKREEVLEYIRATYDYSLDALKEASLEHPSLRNLLSLEGDPLELNRAYFFAIIGYIQEQPNMLEEGELLTPREQSLMQMARMICTCGPGKLDGIFKFYRDLPEGYQIPVVQTTDEPPEIQHVKGVISETVIEELSKKFTKSLITRVLGGVEDIKELPHQELYVRNLIGPVVGLPHRVTFDPHTLVLYDDLTIKTREEVLDVFYEDFTPDVLVQALHKKVNEKISPLPEEPGTPRDMSLYNNITNFMPGEDAIEVWEFDEVYNVTGFTTYGALALLKKAGYIAS
ncbi:MAG: hypothetical protein KR126chlam3_00782 [Chlamydiae bacterium]|nr:hypothetical protein [Chlamydiota bacterium]